TRRGGRTTHRESDEVVQERLPPRNPRIRRGGLRKSGECDHGDEQIRPRVRLTPQVDSISIRISRGTAHPSSAARGPGQKILKTACNGFENGALLAPTSRGLR